MSLSQITSQSVYNLYKIIFSFERNKFHHLMTSSLNYFISGVTFIEIYNFQIMKIKM